MYEVIEIRTIQEVKELFPNGIANAGNWLLLSTGGIHGSFSTIEDAEYILRGEDPRKQPLPNGRTLITVLVLQPGQCVMRWGEIQVNMDDLDYLRKLVRSSLKFIDMSQSGNV